MAKLKPGHGYSLDLDPDPMDLMDLRLTGFGSRSNPSISYTGGSGDLTIETPLDYIFTNGKNNLANAPLLGL